MTDPFAGCAFLVRSAGLPWSSLDPFFSGGNRCLEIEGRLNELERTLHLARRRLLDIIHDRLLEYPTAHRRFLLKVKRDCHNQRPLGRHSRHPNWRLVNHLAPTLAEQILELESDTEVLGVSLGEHLRESRDSEGRALLDQFDNPLFRRGVAVASPGLVSAVRKRKKRPIDLANRKDRKLEQSMLRFVSRAVGKTSPFSTLTTVSLGRVGSSSSPGLQFEPEALEVRSLVRCHRWWVERVQDHLLKAPAIRERCGLVLNDTVKRVDQDRYQFLRPAHWAIDAQSGDVSLRGSMRIALTLKGEPVRYLLALLGKDEPLPYPRVTADMQSVAESASATTSLLDRLIELGFLILLPPWPSYEPCLEDVLLDVSRAAGLPRIADSLDLLVQAKEAFTLSPSPERDLFRIEALQEEALEVCRHVAGHADGTMRHDTSTEGIVYEDTSLEPSPRAENSGGDVARLSSDRISELLHHGDAVFRYAYFFSHRHDLINAIVALWDQHWPERREVPFLELFDAALPMWNGYLEFHKDYSNQLYSSFDPFESEAGAELQRQRIVLAQEVQEAMQTTRSGVVAIDPDRLSKVLSRLPPRYLPKIGPCLFVQPADSTASTWVVNRIFEGTGRYSGRYCRALSPTARRTFSEQMARGGRHCLAAGQGELLDLFYSGGATSNTRHPYAQWVLQAPGENVPDPSRRVLFHHLVIRRASSTNELTLHDARTGRHYLPVHLSSLNHAFLPTMLRFLAVFGPYEVRQVMPRPDGQRGVHGMMHPRVVFGPLVLRRRRWELTPPSECRSSLPDAKQYLAVQRWRREAGLPRIVYYYEETTPGSKSFKPQFLDFGSPAFVDLWLASIKTREHGIYEEALPGSEACPPAGNGELITTELQIDSWILGSSGRIENPTAVESLRRMSA